MSDHLFEPPEPLPVLTEKQVRGYMLAQSTPGGITADELGAIEHERRGRHHRDSRCEWCAAEGKSVLESVALKPLLVRRRELGRYVPRDGSGTPVVPVSAQLAELPDDLFGIGDAA